MTDESPAIPAFLLEQLSTSYGSDDLAQILDGYRAAAHRPVTLRANTLKTDADEVAEALERAGIPYERAPWYNDAFVLDGIRERTVWDLDIYREGNVYLQSLSSMLPPLLLQPKPAADILDMCAAPGGKTAQIAALTGSKAHLTACELNAPRAEKLSFNLNKLGASNVNIMRTDARRLDEFFSFDQILLDAPCTGSGTVRANDSKAEKRLTAQLLSKVTRSQRALLDRALTVLKSGGTLVYSTCSILPSENGEQVEAALKRHRDCRIVPILLKNVEAEAAGEQDKHGEPNPVVLANANTGAYAVPTLPGSLDGTLTVAPTREFEGFFACVIQKKGAVPKLRMR